MSWYVLIASTHHLLAFSLIAILVAEAILIRRLRDKGDVKLLGGIDRWYGIVAGLLVAAGLVRVYFGETAAEDYWANTVFVAKFGLFIVIALLSVPPTIAIIRWNRTLVSNGAMPSQGDIAKVRLWLNAEIILIAVLPILAAALGRGVGY
jgi:putative membrane protein